MLLCLDRGARARVLCAVLRGGIEAAAAPSSPRRQRVPLVAPPRPVPRRPSGRQAPQARRRPAASCHWWQARPERATPRRECPVSSTPTREAAAHDVVGRTRSKPPLRGTRKENTCDIRGQVKCKCRLAAPQIQRPCTLDFLAGWALHTTAAPMALATKQKVGLEMLGVSVCTQASGERRTAHTNRHHGVHTDPCSC